MSTRALMAGLGYGGLLPFYAAALWAAAKLPGAEAAVQVFLVYAAVILSFLGGTLWGYAVKVPPPEKYARIVLSNLVALFAAVALLAALLIAGGSPVAVVLLVAGQLGLLLWERSRGDIGGWYLRLRTRLTLAVIPAHVLTVYALLV